MKNQWIITCYVGLLENSVCVQSMCPTTLVVVVVVVVVYVEQRSYAAAPKILSIAIVQCIDRNEHKLDQFRG